MNKIASQILECMTGFETEDRVVRARFLFPEEFVGFQGHFPDKKVLPGVCQIQSALVSVGKARQRAVVLKEITLAKYFAPVGPREEILCTCSDVAGAGEFTFKVAITKGTTKVAELKLRVALEDSNDVPENATAAR